MENANSAEEMQSDEYLKVNVNISCNKIEAASVVVEAQLQEANAAPKQVYKSQPTSAAGKKVAFASPLLLDYVFQIRQLLCFNVFDASDKKLIGKVEATIAELYKGRDKGVTKDITNQGQVCGQFHMKCEKVDKSNKKAVEFDLEVNNLDVGSGFMCFGVGTAHWRLVKTRNNKEQVVYESEIRPGPNNKFDTLKMDQGNLCNNDPKQPITLRFCKASSDSVLGQAKFDLNTLIEGRNKLSLTSGGQDKGSVTISNFKNVAYYNFTDYLSAGLEVSMVVGIDFTNGNGVQTQPNSLHYHSEGKRNQYEEALHEVGSIVLDYDNSKNVPCYGFGAKVKMPNFSSSEKVSHCFPINGSESKPALFKIEGIEEGYKNCLQYLQFSEPTLLCPLLKEVMATCHKMKEQRKEYMILLILTNGVIHDMEEVKDLLVKCGKLPLSIIIVGIGKGQGGWQSMHELDDNDMMMTDKQGNKTVRDLVHFVEFQKHNNNGVELASDVLYELPRQVAEYHELNDLTPEVYRKR